MTFSELVTHRGGCHCQAIRFEVDAPAVIRVSQCNCSICTKSGYLALIVPAQHFRLLQGEDVLTEYRFNTGRARHRFCARCGVKSFYIPRSHPDGVSVNVRCLDPGTVSERIVTATDGQNWEALYRDGADNEYPNFPGWS